jgi:hypothetical protein
MRKLRSVLCWAFAGYSSGCVVAAYRLIRHTIRSQEALLPLRHPLIAAPFLVLAAIFGVAWWTVWSQKVSAKGWAIAASLLSLLGCIPLLYLFRFSSFWQFEQVSWIPEAIGVAGLVAFSRPYKRPGAPLLRSSQK